MAKMEYYKEDYNWEKGLEVLVFMDFELHKSFSRVVDFLMVHKPKILAGNINEEDNLQPQVVMSWLNYQMIKEKLAKGIEMNEFLNVYVVDDFKGVPKGKIELGRLLDSYSYFNSGSPPPF